MSSSKPHGYSPGGPCNIDWIDGVIPTTDFDKADFLVLPGGSDVDPVLYGHSKMSGTSSSLSSDLGVVKLISNAILRGMPIIGICKGLQQLHVYAGGTLFQHIVGHSSSGIHMVSVLGKQVDEISTNSLHHQMVNIDSLNQEDFHLIGWISNNKSTEYHINGEIIKDIKYEPEIVYYPKIKGLGFQFHPEMMSRTTFAVQYASELSLKLIESQDGSKSFWNF